MSSCLGVACALALVCMSYLAPVAQAQDTPKVEVFAGYSYMPLKGPDGHGLNVSVTTNLNHRVGLTADFSGHFGTGRFSSQTTGFSDPSRGNIRLYNLFYGPRLMIGNRGRATVFGHSLFGLSHSFAQTFPPPSQPQLPIEFSGTGFGMALGGTLDIELNSRLALRPIRADYLFSRFVGRNHHDFRYSGGIVIRLGRLRPPARP